ncbi:MAG: 1,3-beta-galactosyl-N-acetylhexosamine phosphorylase [Varibaculum sp.]|nr:1,3-beta-galactosyl-N-acetylhexosamine phosphorylase [Varibaculum sp.]
MSTGRVTIPTDLDIVAETKEIAELWGADAIRDADGTEFPAELSDTDLKVYSTYYTTRKDNEWARKNPDEVQQCYIMTGFHTATGTELRIRLMEGISEELLKVNTRDDIKRWWEVIDRTTGEVVDTQEWDYDEAQGTVVIAQPQPWHEYTVSFLAYIIWDPVHMYNAITNNWQDFEHQITFDVRQPKTHEWSLKRLRKFIADHPYVDVIRYTTFFHQFTLIFDELKREKYVDWYGYSASVSPYILEKFETEVGYRFRPEYIIDQGYYNNQYRVPSREYLDFMAFQRREVAALAKEFVDVTHEMGKEAMMFLGDHWIGTEPYLEEFAEIGLDAVVGSVGNAATLRLISDIKGVKYTEGRLLPYFFPDVFHPGGDPLSEAKTNWVNARRAILRHPVDRIGYGGYLKLALDFPEFVDFVAKLTEEFRQLYDNIGSGKPWCAKTVAVLNSWGQARSWGCHMVHHGIYHRQNYSYFGVLEALAGSPFDVRFISFNEVAADAGVLDDVDVIINVGDGDTAQTGGEAWEDPRISSAIRRFVFSGGGFIGIGEPAGHQWEGRYIQVAPIIGIEKETGFTLGYDKYNLTENPQHFILADATGDLNFGEGQKGMYALEGATVLNERFEEVQMAVNEYGKGRGVYISGLPYSAQNSRVLRRAIMWAANSEDDLKRWYSDNYEVDVHAYPNTGKYCVVNNSEMPATTTVYHGNGKSFELELTAGEIRWYDI